MTAISTKVVKLDLDFILDNFYKPALWGKKWTIFEYDGYFITFEILHIEINNKRLWCHLGLNKGGETLRSNYLFLPFDKAHRNLKVLNRRLSSSVASLIKSFEEDLIKMRDAYIEADRLEHEFKEYIRILAIEFLDDEGVANSDIREAYINAQVNNADTPNYSGKVIKEYQYTILSKLHLSWFYFADAEYFKDVIDKVGRLNGFKVGAIRKEIQKELDAIVRGDFKDTIELDEIY